MKIKLIIILATFNFLGCKFQKNVSSDTISEHYIQGELAFKLINIGNYYGLDDAEVIKYKNFINEFEQIENKTKSDSSLVDYFAVLKDNDLMYLPSFKLKIDSTKSVIVFLSKKEYKKIKKYDMQELLSQNKKVWVSLKGEYITEYIIKCETIEKVIKNDGKTDWQK